MKDYSPLLRGLADARKQIEQLIRASDDNVEVTHLYAAKLGLAGTERNVLWARECHDNPRMEVTVKHE